MLRIYVYETAENKTPKENKAANKKQDSCPEGYTQGCFERNDPCEKKAC